MRLTHLPCLPLMFLSLALNWWSGVPWLMRPLAWTVSTEGGKVRLHCGCGRVVRERPIGATERTTTRT